MIIFYWYNIGCASFYASYGKIAVNCKAQNFIAVVQLVSVLNSKIKLLGQLKTIKCLPLNTFNAKVRITTHLFQ